MAEDDHQSQPVHKHYHLWPDSDCGCFMLIALFLVLCTIESLARLDKLPW